jgi:undecaprenyl-diphosphatase
MTVLQGIFLGIIQGLTEFLPVSSSGHLVLLQHYFHVQESGLLFEVLVHFGTLTAVVIAFWEDIWSLLRRPFQKLTLLLIVGTIPAAIVGLAFRGLFEKLFTSITAVAVALLITGGILWLVETYAESNKSLAQMGNGSALIVGLAQALAIAPGISRSGATIAAALFTGLDKRSAARYSFLLSIPAILGATVLEVRGLAGKEMGQGFLSPYLLGMLAAAVTGFFAIRLLINLLNRGKLYYFSFYCWAVGILALLTQAF